MKRILVFVLALMLCSGALADTGIDWTQYPDDELQSMIDDLTEMLNEAQAEIERRTETSEATDDDFIEGMIADQKQTSEVKEKILEAFEYYQKMILFQVDRVEVNPNYGTTVNGDFIASIYMTYDKKTDKTSDYDMIVKCATNVATVITHGAKEVCEMVVYVDLPAYDSSAKIQQFVNEKGRLEYGDAMFPKVMVN